MPLPRLTALVALLLALALVTAGCGGDDADPRERVLAHFPADAPLVALLETDPESAQGQRARELIGRFPGSGVAIQRALSLIQAEGLEFERDIRPLLGEELAIGASTVDALEANRLMGAWVVADEGRLDDLVERAGWEEAGEHRGATLYRGGDEGSAFAVDGSLVIFAEAVEDVRAALDRAEGNETMTPGRFDEALEGLPGEAGLRVHGNGAALLDRPQNAQARQVPWVNAIRSFGLTVSAREDDVVVDARVATPEGDLEAEDLPLPDGAESPSLAGGAAILAGARDLAHVLGFAQRAGEAVNPGGFRAFEAAKSQIGAALRVDLDRDVIGQLRGATSVETDGRAFSARSDLEDPGAMARALDRLEPIMPSFLGGAGIRGAQVSRQGGDDGLYVVQRGGRYAGAYGVSEDRLVVGTAPVDRLVAHARAPDGEARGAEGALAARVSGSFLRERLARALGLGGPARLAVAPIGDADGWVRAETDALRARVRVAVE